MSSEGMINLDCFAGGGGASLGMTWAGCPPSIAINHDPEAIAMHAANHPEAEHFCQDVFEAKPLTVTRGRKVYAAWFSPDCTHHSKAKGGKPRDSKRRALAWVVVDYARDVQPVIIFLENVEEFADWGPLDEEGRPIKSRRGEDFKNWVEALRALGYAVEWREMAACDYGAPTTRKRLYLVARCDGKPIIWPAPTHSKRGQGGLKPWRMAAEIIDWSLPCPSIFMTREEARAYYQVTGTRVQRPLKDKTMARIAKGVWRYVINAHQPFIVPVTHAGERRGHGANEPLPVVTGAHRGELALVAPLITKFRTGATGHAIDEPLHTITANSFEKRPGGATPLGLVEATIAPFFARTAHGDVDKTGKRRGQSDHAATDPFPTVTTSQDSAFCAVHLTKFSENSIGELPSEPLHTVMAGAPRHGLVSAFLAQHNNDRSGPKPGRDAELPLSTVTTTGSHQGVVAASLIGCGGRAGQSRPRGLDEPVATATTKADACLAAAHLVNLKGSGRAREADAPMFTACSGGNHIAEVRAFLIKYYGSGVAASLFDPIDTITSEDRFGLVTIEGQQYQIVDIGMRMLTARELARGQGLPDEYELFPIHNGKRLTATSAVRMIGNSVSPYPAAAIIRANTDGDVEMRRAA